MYDFLLVINHTIGSIDPTNGCYFKKWKLFSCIYKLQRMNMSNILLFILFPRKVSQSTCFWFYFAVFTQNNISFMLSRGWCTENWRAGIIQTTFFLLSCYSLFTFVATAMRNIVDYRPNVISIIAAYYCLIRHKCYKNNRFLRRLISDKKIVALITILRNIEQWMIYW